MLKRALSALKQRGVSTEIVELTRDKKGMFWFKLDMEMNKDGVLLCTRTRIILEEDFRVGLNKAIQIVNELEER